MAGLALLAVTLLRLAQVLGGLDLVVDTVLDRLVFAAEAAVPAWADQLPGLR